MRLATDHWWTRSATEEQAVSTVRGRHTQVHPMREVAESQPPQPLAPPEPIAPPKLPEPTEPPQSLARPAPVRVLPTPTPRGQAPHGEDALPEIADVFEIGERCAEAYRRSEALHYEALRLLAEFDRRSGFEEAGFPTAADWLAWRVGIKIGPARERVRTARALAELPQTAAAMRQGGLSFAKARALTRVATPENEETLLQFARAGSAANLERVVRGWKELNRAEEITAEQARFRRRRFSAFIDDDGMVVVRGRLDPEAGAMLMRAVEAASDALFRSTTGGPATHGGPASKEDPQDTTPEQRRADAVGLLAERALNAGFGATAPVSGQRAARTEVVLHVEASTLDEAAEPGLSELEDGTRVSAETSRRVVCDTGVVEVHTDREGPIHDTGPTPNAAPIHSAGRIRAVSHRRRTVSPALRRALEVRDRGCRFPGCGLRFTDAHHIRHWADGGETRLDNLVLLCRRHHRAVHEGGMRVCLGSEAEVVFFDRKGRAMCGEPAPGRGGRTLEASVPAVAELQLSNASDLASGWKRDRDLPWEVEAAVWDALDPPVSTAGSQQEPSDPRDLCAVVPVVDAHRSGPGVRGSSTRATLP